MRTPGTRRPADGVAPAPAEDVLTALLGLNRPELPYVIRGGAAGDAELVAEWRLAEPVWQPFFVASQVSRAVRISMRLDREDHEVRALEESWAVERFGNPPRIRVTSQYTRGPGRTVSGYRRIQDGDDGRLEAREYFRFDSSQLRAPLRDSVVKLGWTWRGVVFGRL